MRIKEQIEVQASIIDCYKMGINFEHYHEILPAIKSVKHKGSPEVWHWEVEGPNGQLLEWDIEIKGEKHSNQVISWHTVRQADIAHSGAITFNPINATTTLVQLVIEFSNSSGEGQCLDTEFRTTGQRIIEKFLLSYKNFVETNRGVSISVS